ncbi:hypothetical protein SAY87_002477 [Trapa incisa]|nr:hypothetical protein SAY87_002477 [Trapa incisa]
MGSRIPAHQLSGGLYVSGRPENPKERAPPTMASRSVIYTGGDVKKSGELGKMFDIPVSDNPPPLKTSRPSSSSQHNSGPNSGPATRHSSGSGPIKKTSGPMNPLAPTGLITSGPLGSGPIGSTRRPGQLESTGSMKATYGSAVTNLGTEGVRVRFRISKVVVWIFLVVVAVGLLVAAFLAVAVKDVVIILAVAGLLVPVVIVGMWNWWQRRRRLLGFLKSYPDAELRGAIDGQYVKVTGVVTCGSIPLESSYQRVPRCVYVSTELYEHRGCSGKSVNPKHHCFSWGMIHSEKHVADFYISDFQSGLRALVKAGYGAKVSPFVKPSVVDITRDKKELSPAFLQWLADRNLSGDDCIMRLKEGYIKEGSTVSVMGVVRRQDNILMIVPPSDPIFAGCQWACCLLPTYAEGLILTCEENQTADVVNV